MSYRPSSKEFRKLLAELRGRCPALAPVRVYRRPSSFPSLRGYRGITYAYFDDQDRIHHFVIVLDRSMAEEWMGDVLLHEWAHAVAWREGHETVAAHDPEFALAWSRIYQEMVEP